MATATSSTSAADGDAPPPKAEPDIFAAALQGDLATVRSLMDRRDERMPSGGYSALGLAVSAGHTEIARLLLREGVSVDAADDEGNTALMHAAMHGYRVLVDLLLLHGASPLKTRADGECAHTLAALYGRPAALGAFFRHDSTLVEARNPTTQISIFQTSWPSILPYFHPQLGMTECAISDQADTECLMLARE